MLRTQCTEGTAAAAAIKPGRTVGLLLVSQHTNVLYHASRNSTTATPATTTSTDN